MRNFQYKKPYRLRSSRIEKGLHLYENKPLYFEKVSTVLTVLGIVIVYETDWTTNTKPVKLTIFKTVINGLVYTAELDEQRLSEMQLKWLATNFIKTAIKKPAFMNYRRVNLQT